MSGVARYRYGWLAFSLAGLYSALVIATATMVALVWTFAEDPGFVAIWLILLTAPLSLLYWGMYDLLFPPDATGPFVTVAFYSYSLTAGFVQAWLLWRLFRGRRLDPVAVV